jgi:hypothetical protein
VAGELTGESRTNRGVQGLGFAAGIYISLDCMSTLNSSPWTHQTFGGDPAKRKSAQGFVRLGIASSTALAALTSVLMGSWSPMVGATVTNAGLWYVYHQAGQKAAQGGGESPTAFAWARSSKAA